MNKTVLAGVALCFALAFSPVNALAEDAVEAEALAFVAEEAAVVVDDQAISSDSATSADDSQGQDVYAGESPAAASAEAEVNTTADAEHASDAVAEPVADSESGEDVSNLRAAESETDAAAELEDNSVYTIAPSYASDMRVAVQGDSAAANANVELSANYTQLSELWKTLYHEDGSYSFVNLKGDKALGFDGTPTAGTNVQTVAGEGARWQLISHLDGTFSVVPVGYSSLRLDVAGAGTSVGSNLVLWLANGAVNQNFRLTVQDATTEALQQGVQVDDGIYSIEVEDGSSRVMDVAWASTDPSANVMVFASNKAFNQKYALKSVGNGLYEIQATHSGKLVEVYGGNAVANANVTQYFRNGLLHQLWYLVDGDNGYTIRSAKSGLALTVSDSNLQLSNTGDGSTFSFNHADLLENDTVYRIAASYAQNLMVAAAGNNPSGNTNVQMEYQTDVLGQFWRVQGAEDGSFSLINLLNNRALTIVGGADAQKNVALGDGALLVARYMDGGGIMFLPKSNQAVSLDIPYGSSAVGANVWTWNAIGSAAQKFAVTKVDALTLACRAGMAIDEGIYSILLGSDQNLALDVAGASKDNCAQLLLFVANGQTNQKYELSYLGNGLYNMRSAVSGKLVELYGASGAQGTLVKQFVDNGGLHQMWYFLADDGGYRICSAKSGLAISFAGGKASCFANAALEASGCAPQSFAIKEVPLVANGTYVISSELALPLVLDVYGASKGDGANVELYQSTGGTNQQFVFTYLGDGLYQISNKNSGKVLEVAGESCNYMANIQQWASSRGDHQKWRLGVSVFGGVTFQNLHSGQFLDVEGGVKRNCTNIIQFVEMNNAGQSFNLKDGSWSFGAEVERIARTQLGTSYSYVGSGYFPNDSFNCSGLTWWVYNQAGYNVSHNQGYYSYYTGSANKTDSQMWQVERAGNWKTDPNQLVKGDLVFFSPVYDKWQTGHVGIYIGNNKMIHVWPTTGTAVVDIYSLPKDHFVGGGLPL